MEMDREPPLVPGASSYAGSKLAEWQVSGRELGFVYLRQGGGLVQTGRGCLAAVDEGTLQLAAGACSLLVVHLGAVLMQGPQWFFEAHLNGAYQVEGVSFALTNNDWLFLSEDILPDNIAQSALNRLS